MLFSLYINSLVAELKHRDCGVLCQGMLVSSLLFADDTVLLAESAEDMSACNLGVRNGPCG